MAAAPGSTFLSVQGLVKRFDGVTAVDRVDFDVGRGEVFALLGSSGCGKSTLLRILAGLEAPTAGRVVLDGADVTDLPAWQRPVNMMFQSYALFPHMDVEDNIAFGLRQERLPEHDIRTRVDRMLELVQLARLGRRMPHQLSGGQQQRVALARSLVKHPKLLLLDEPLGALDKKIRQQTRLELLNVIEQVGVTCILVTHDQEEAMTMADRIAVMSEGRFVQVGTPEDLYERPTSRFVADFVGDTNIFYGTVERTEHGRSILSTPDLDSELVVTEELPQTDAVWVSVRPERLEIYRDEPDTFVNTSAARVRDVAYLGATSLLQVELPSGRLLSAAVPTTRWFLDAPPQRGERMYVSWAPGACTVLRS